MGKAKKKFDEVKKHSRKSEILRNNENLTSRSIQQSQQKDDLKVEKLK